MKDRKEMRGPVLAELDIRSVFRLKQDGVQ
jgi:hypothetical protein